MSGRLVLDASTAVHVVMRDAQAPPLIHHLQAATLVLAPRLFAAEISNASGKDFRSGWLDPNAAQQRLAEGLALTDRLEGDEHLVHEALLESGLRSHPVYDLLYLVLARRHGANLLTGDKRLAELSQDLGIAGR